MSDKCGANTNKPKRLTTPCPHSDHEMRSSRVSRSRTRHGSRRSRSRSRCCSRNTHHHSRCRETRSRSRARPHRGGHRTPDRRLRDPERELSETRKRLKLLEDQVHRRQASGDLRRSPSTGKRVLSSHSAEENTPATFNWPAGVVPYLIEPHYDAIIVARIRAAMNTIESFSCVLFKDVKVPPPEEPAPIPWLVIQNPDGVRECSHSTLREQSATILTKAILVLGYDCMQRRDILHALLHVLGFNDEVTHPQRNMYVRIMWENIQPKYRSLFWMRTGGTPHKMVEYDTMSIMHFHNRAYSVNGGATILPLISDLRIAPSDKLSQLDVMKLRLAFGHECNKRKVGNLLDTCQNVLKDNDNEQAEKSEEHSEDSGSLHDFSTPLRV